MVMFVSFIKDLDHSFYIDGSGLFKDLGPLKMVFQGENDQIAPLNLKAPNKNCSRRHFNFLLLSLEENKA